MTDTVKAKFVCRAKDSTGGVTLDAVIDGSAENRAWSEYTPAGTLHMQVSKKGCEAEAFFVLGQEYYIDITAAPVNEPKGFETLVPET
jgi:hypothetical protein